MYETVVDDSLKSLEANNISRRIWAHDYSVWALDPTEVSNRLDWLHAPEMMLDNLHRFDEVVKEVRSAGYANAVLLGMGGSALTSKVLAKIFKKKEGYLDLTVLDDIDPKDVLALEERLNMEKTLFIVSSKSGGTIETLSLLKYFYGRSVKALGQEEVGRHFVAISDPGTKLASIADSNHFLDKVLNDPNIGGRYSGLSFDGLVPAALMGLDLPRLLEQALKAASDCGPSILSRDNPGIWLGAVLGELAMKGKDKATIITTPSISSFGDWLEQLIAESTGKKGRGILPVLRERLGEPDSYGFDRFFVYIALDGESDPRDEEKLLKLGRTNPVITLRLTDAYEVGNQMFLWEVAVAVAGHIMGVNPFDQPNVESSKVSAKAMIADYRATRSLPFPEPGLTKNGITVYGNEVGEDPDAMLVNFLKQAEPGAYIAIQAYLEPTGRTDTSLDELRKRMRGKLKVATTAGYGPRYLHSTGQLHKGDAGRGLFVQLVAEDLPDVPIPEELGSERSSASFGVLMKAQALGDRQALLDLNRKVITLGLKGDVLKALSFIEEALG